MKYTEREKGNLRSLYRSLAECTVLLKRNEDFPLKKAGEIALYGNGARHTVRGGTGSGEVNSRHPITVEKGLEMTGFTVTTKAWLDGYDEILKKAEKAFVETIRQRAKEKHVMAVMEGMGAVMPEPEYDLPLSGKGEAAVYVLSRISGEGNDREAVRGDILLTETERRDILRLRERYPAFMLVLNTGGPVDLTPVMAVENILLLSQLGDLAGRLLGDILLGKKVPSGKLTSTWTAWEDQPPMLDFGNMNDTRYKEGIYVGYRYYDTVGKKPLFPFGFGLSYTSFETGSVRAALEGEEVTVCACVRNTGLYPGKQVLQLYLSKPQGSLDQPYQELAAWAKSRKLRPGEEQELTIRFPLSQMTSFDPERSAYVLEKGDHILRLGESSRDTAPCGIIRLEEDVIVRRVRHALGTTDFRDFVPDKRSSEEAEESAYLRTELPVMVLDTDAIATEEIVYAPDPTPDPRTERMTDEELLYLGIGAFDPKGGPLSIIGDASTMVAGASGETTHQLPGYPSLVMADGPAGLRLSQRYWKDEKGTHGLDNSLIESLTRFMPKYQQVLVRFMMKKKAPKGAEIREQYTTAIPIGTAIAQSWNLDFARKCGDIVASEMEEFGAQLWLAPALNIHRSIRCGRNFEYYSEDPVISGCFAAAVTCGVQSHPGYGVTLKHFAANNQELNRYFNNSVVSERAMREIYLKGFEICIRKAQPEALMTSYNLLNGIHTAERRDLTVDILRHEFGFEGLVMTDWLVAAMFSKDTAYPGASAERIAAAGGDIVMPGTKSDYKHMLEALQAGTLERRQLMVNASRVLRTIERLIPQGKS